MCQTLMVLIICIQDSSDDEDSRSCKLPTGRAIPKVSLVLEIPRAAKFFPDVSGRTELMLAAMSGDRDRLRELLAEGSDKAGPRSSKLSGRSAAFI